MDAAKVRTLHDVQVDLSAAAVRLRYLAEVMPHEQAVVLRDAMRIMDEASIKLARTLPPRPALAFYARAFELVVEMKTRPISLADMGECRRRC